LEIQNIWDNYYFDFEPNSNFKTLLPDQREQKNEGGNMEIIL
jgi:hypothetical protein